MEPDTVAQAFYSILKLKPIPSVSASEQDQHGSKSYICQADYMPSKFVSTPRLKRLIATKEFQYGAELLDLKLRITTVYQVMEKAFYMSVFLAFKTADGIFSFIVTYTTQGRCLHITPLDR